MRRTVAGLLLGIAVTSVGGSRAIAAEATDARADRIYLRVEAGDTYMNLFGRDWQRAWDANKVFVRRNGQMVSSPDILLEGAILAIDPSLMLTERAASRARELDARRGSGFRRLEALRASLSGRADARAPLGELERLLSSRERFVAENDAVERVLRHLDALANFTINNRGVPKSPGFPTPLNTSLLVMIVIAVMGVSFVASRRLRHRQERPLAENRYVESVRAVERAFQGL